MENASQRLSIQPSCISNQRFSRLVLRDSMSSSLECCIHQIVIIGSCISSNLITKIPRPPFFDDIISQGFCPCFSSTEWNSHVMITAVDECTIPFTGNIFMIWDRIFKSKFVFQMFTPQPFP